MELIYDLNEKRASECVIALGFFDGVHLGHRELLEKARLCAGKSKIPFGIFTFKSSDGIKRGAKRIYSDSTKASIFSSLGADFTVFADFPELSGLTAEQFVRDILVGKLNARVAVAGYNYRFGKGAEGDAKSLEKLMQANGKEALICDEFRLGGQIVSSTVIRDALDTGDIALANRLLGAPYNIFGKVTRGRGEGKRLGFPTINTHPSSDLLIPRRGVYHTAVRVGDKLCPALTNVGTCPTFEERESHLETYLLNFSGNLYDEDVSIYFIDYLRDEIAFPSEKELIMQINVDKIKVLNKSIDNLEI